MYLQIMSMTFKGLLKGLDIHKKLHIPDAEGSKVPEENSTVGLGNRGSDLGSCPAWRKGASSSVLFFSPLPISGLHILALSYPFSGYGHGGGEYTSL